MAGCGERGEVHTFLRPRASARATYNTDTAEAHTPHMQGTQAAARTRYKTEAAHSRPDRATVSVHGDMVVAPPPHPHPPDSEPHISCTQFSAKNSARHTSSPSPPASSHEWRGRRMGGGQTAAEAHRPPRCSPPCPPSGSDTCGIPRAAQSSSFRTGSSPVARGTGGKSVLTGRRCAVKKAARFTPE